MKKLVDDAWIHHEFQTVAVRSSSPEEDLGGASFAGGYETILGVRLDGLYTAILKAFLSCLDARVVMYKAANGFSTLAPSIAVVVQDQVDSDVSGVAFSVNPLTNCNAEVFVNSNFGLGETVVSGIVSPDEFVVDKKTGKILSKTVGKKELIVKLRTEGGVLECELDKAVSDRLSLDENLIAEISKQVQIIEALYQNAIDIEFGISNSRLYILQARPVTTSLPFPVQIENKKVPHIFWDVTLGVQGLTSPMSVLSTSFFSLLPHLVLEKLSHTVLDHNTPAIPVVIIPEIGRVYIDVSILESAYVKKIHEMIPLMDPIAGEILGSLDLTVEFNKSFTDWWFLLRLLEYAPYFKFARSVVDIVWDPTLSGRKLDIEIDTKMKLLKECTRKPRSSVLEWSLQLFYKFIDLLFTTFMPRMFLWRKSSGDLKKLLEKLELLSDEDGKLNFSKLERSLPGNVTVKMGLELTRIANELKKQGDFIHNLSPSELGDALSGKSKSDLSDSIKLIWKNFLEIYGHRGDTELDFATPRYREEAKTLLIQICQQISSTDESKDPILTYEKCQSDRKQAYEYFISKINAKGSHSDLKSFKNLYEIVISIGGFRETPKFFVIKIFDQIRQEMLQIGEKLTIGGRIDNPQEIFDLNIVDVDKVMLEFENNENETNVGLLREKRLRIWSRWNSYARSGKELPRIIDSTGRIYRPVPKFSNDANSLVGYPVSPGVVEGKIKMLSKPDEKPVLPGEILVARCTNPGWTPLFINSAAVILEVGGVLQHGALVAREYGIPAVAGIVGLMEDQRLKDGVRVRVDGNIGIVTIIDDGISA
ncbi:hypothetical protein HK096_003870 [Nowakowskiella sp. JEL0078]|nr:hypothetical protein HK096_003870 [Nowakowskiella sp. JEL0078]